LNNVGVATPGSVEALSKIIALVPAGLLPKSVSYSTVEEMMGQEKVAMIGVPALISSYDRMAKDSALLRELKLSLDDAEVMPNVPQMSRFFSSLSAALQTTTDRASAQAALQDAEANMRRRQ
jgi:maltose-binding protein MalE